MRLLLDLDAKAIVAEYEWRSDQRVPVVGEFLDVGPTVFVVTEVRWGLQYPQAPGAVPANDVTLQVARVDDH